jgi:flagellum-specific ATP synthase
MWIDAECIGFEGDTTYLMAFDQVSGLSPGAVVYPLLTPQRGPHGYRMRQGIASLPIGLQLLGRVVDGLGRPLDGLGGATWSDVLTRTPSPNPLKRAPIQEPLDTGVRAINALLTVGRGQRLGLFAGSGVGKSVLLGMMARYTAADVIVVGLIGERGREVKEFIEEILGHTGRARSVVVVVAPSTPGTYSIDSLNVDTGPAGDPNPTVNLAKLVVSGDASTNATSLQYALTQPAADQASINPTVASVAKLEVKVERTLRFS